MDGPDLSGRTALVTGSARGIGRAFLLAIASCGASVAVHYNTSEDAALAVAASAESRGAEDVTVVQGDVTDPESVEAIVSSVEDDLGGVEVLVNNVGDFAPVHWRELSPDDWRRVIETNLTATYLCSRRVLPSMREGDYARIVNLGNASSEKGLVSPVNFPYFVAKAGVIMFTRMLAADTQDDPVTVNAISPFVVENSDTMPADIPRDRPASFEDLVRPLYWFLDPAADYVSGQNVEVDGGWLPEDV